MTMQHSVRDERAARSTGAPGRSESMRAPVTESMRCPHCGYHPASPRIFGFCSWDCHDADADEEEDPVAA
jgi:hypothetical protein